MDDILGIRHITNQRARQAEELPCVPIHEFMEGPIIAVSSPSHELQIGRLQVTALPGQAFALGLHWYSSIPQRFSSIAQRILLETAVYIGAVQRLGRSLGTRSASGLSRGPAHPEQMRPYHGTKADHSQLWCIRNNRPATRKPHHVPVQPAIMAGGLVQNAGNHQSAGNCNLRHSNALCHIQNESLPVHGLARILHYNTREAKPCA